MRWYRAAHMWAFDLIELDGADMRREPLAQRKASLERALARATPGLRFNEHLHDEDGPLVFHHVEAQSAGIAGCCAHDGQPRDSRFQSPKPGFGEKYWNLSAFPSHSFQSGGGAFLTLIFGQIFAYSVFNDSHFSSPGSISALMASTGHSGSQTPQSIHSSGWMTSIFSPS
jgi:hypothetical protein